MADRTSLTVIQLNDSHGEAIMELQTAYAFGRRFNTSFSEVELRVRAELAKEGFGVLTEFNVKNKFKEKLGRDFRDYVILGACNPALAWEAFAKEINIGTLLPCNVVVYRDDDNRTVDGYGSGGCSWCDR